MKSIANEAHASSIGWNFYLSWTSLVACQFVGAFFGSISENVEMKLHYPVKFIHLFICFFLFEMQKNEENFKGF